MRARSGADRLRFSEADQIEIDVEAGMVDLRAARTIGTSEPVNWRFETRKTALDDDGMAVRKLADGTIVGGGVYGAGAQAFALRADGTLTWTTVMLAESSTIKWACRK